MTCTSLQAFVARCLQKDPSARPTASTLLKDKFLRKAKSTSNLAQRVRDGIAERKAARLAQGTNSSMVRPLDRGAGVGAGCSPCTAALAEPVARVHGRDGRRVG